MPFTLPTLDQSNMFALAQDWTGITQNGNTTPDWWLWQYFGTVALSDTNLDSQGTNTLLYDYTNGLDPNIITFTLSATSRYVNQAAVPVQVSLLAGVPSYYAVLLNDTNTAAATWLAYPGTNLTVNLGSTDGTYTVTVGLRGRPLSATQSWQTLTFFQDTTPLTLGLTNLSSLSGSRPFIDPAGYASRSLSALTWTVVDATGNTNTGNGMVVAQDWSLSDQWHTTNWFQCVDLSLALGTNWICIQAMDWAGSVAVTNFAYVFDTNGDSTAPALSLVWPPEGAHVSGDSFTVQATTDDDTAAVALQYFDGDGILQTMNGRVERGGKVWVPDVPLAAGTNSLSVLTTDAAGNVTTNNLTVVRSSTALTIYELTQDQMKYGYATVTGTVEDQYCTVTVNGVTATNTSGSWSAGGVPIQPGGTVVLQATAQMAGGATVRRMLTQERGPIVFTQTYEYKLDYSFDGGSTNTWESHHFELHWARGVGGTNVETSWRLNGDGSVSSNYYMAVWPPDNGYWPSLHAQTWTASYWNGVLTDSLAWTADPPSVEWMEKSSSAGSRPDLENVSWSESSGREVRLFTGGSAARQKQGLFDLSASLNIESVLDPEVYAWGERYPHPEFVAFLSPESPPVGVPPQEIALSAVGKLGNGGRRYTVQSSGNELVITPTTLVTSYSGDLPWVTKHVLISHTLHQALTNPDPERTKLGVGEEVSIYFDPELQMAFPETPWWLAFDGSVWPNVGSAVTFTAPSNAVPRTTVRVFVRDAQLDKYFTVVEPQSYDHAVIVSTNRYWPPMSAAGMQLKVFFAPTDVSLYRVEIEEVGGYAIDLSGVYLTYPPEEHISDVFRGLNDDNSWNRLDDCEGGAKYGYPGGFTWPIPANWRIPGGSTNPMTGWNQVFSIDEAGTCEIDKFDRWVRRSTNNIVTTH